MDTENKNDDNLWIVELTKAEKREIKQEVKEILKNDNNKNIDWIKTDLSLEEKITNLFDSIEFLSLNYEQKEQVAIKVKNDATWDKLYWIEILLSSIIAALWLIQNSVAVVIWAMLIAPLLRPINWLSFSIARWWQKFFISAFNVLFFSIFLSILMWYIVAIVLWLNIQTTEILSRSTPNLIDFFIAIFSAMVAVLSLRFSRLWESVAWVAMAASLMPPLVVVWIELALWNYSSSFWAFTLFSANLLAILFVSTVFFWLYWFSPNDLRKQSKVFKRISLVLISIIIVLIPLFASYNSIKSNVEISNEVRNYIISQIDEKYNNYFIDDIKIISNTSTEILLPEITTKPITIKEYETNTLNGK